MNLGTQSVVCGFRFLGGFEGLKSGVSETGTRLWRCW